MTTQVVAIEFFESCYFRRLQTLQLVATLLARHASKGLAEEHKNFEGFDPGSERTLAAWIRHASRTNPGSNIGGSGERGSKAWVTYPGDGDSHSNEWVIPGDSAGRHLSAGKRVSPREGLM